MSTSPTMSTPIALTAVPQEHRDVYQWSECVLTMTTPKGADVSPYVRTCSPGGFTDSYFRFTLDGTIYSVTPGQSLWQAVRERWQAMNYGRPV